MPPGTYAQVLVLLTLRLFTEIIINTTGTSDVVIVNITVVISISISIVDGYVTCDIVTGCQDVATTTCTCDMALTRHVKPIL